MTKLKLIPMTLLAASCALAQLQPTTAAVDLGKAPSIDSSKVKPNAAVLRPNAVNSTPIRDTLIASEVTIAPKDYKMFESGYDYSGAEKVGISVTTLNDPNSRLTNVQFGVAFAGPGEWYVLTKVINGSDFPFMDHGGATVDVYGPGLKIAVFNKWYDARQDHADVGVRRG